MNLLNGQLDRLEALGIVTTSHEDAIDELLSRHEAAIDFIERSLAGANALAEGRAPVRQADILKTLLLRAGFRTGGSRG